MTEVIPLDAVPFQRLSVVLDGQNCVLTCRQLGDALYLSLECDQVPIFENELVNRMMEMPAHSTPDFLGRLMMVDTQGREQPNYAGLGSRFFLLFKPDDEEWA